jgi:thioredoxin reductase
MAQPLADHNLYDLLCVGIGPAGLSAMTRASDLGLTCLGIEKAEDILDTIRRFRPRKHVMALPANAVLPKGCISIEEGTSEHILHQLTTYSKEYRLNIQTKTEVTGVVKRGDTFEVETTRGLYRCINVALGVGAANLRELKVPGARFGKELVQVRYTVPNPDDYSHKRVIVIGAGDVGIELALYLSQKNKVSIVNRSAGLWRTNAKLRNMVEANDEITVYLKAHVLRIETGGG